MPSRKDTQCRLPNWGSTFCLNARKTDVIMTVSKARSNKAVWLPLFSPSTHRQNMKGFQPQPQRGSQHSSVLTASINYLPAAK